MIFSNFGEAILELTDAVSNKDISSEILVGASKNKTKGNARRKFQVDSLNNTQVSWRLKIPKGFQAIQYKVIAKAGDFSDGEQNWLPV